MCVCACVCVCVCVCVHMYVDEHCVRSQVPFVNYAVQGVSLLETSVTHTESL